ETAEQDATYGWDPQRQPVPFSWERAFPGRPLESIGVREMESGIRAALDRIDPDAVAITSYSHPDARAALVWCRRRRRVAILMSDSKADDAPRVRWREWTKRQLVAQYDAALVAGTAHAAYVEHLGVPRSLIFRPVDVVDNGRYAEGADAARMDPTRAADSIGLPVRGPYFIAVGRMITRKNLDTLLVAYGTYRQRTLRNGVPPWPLVLVGDGPEADRLRGIAAREADGGVVFAGFRQIDELVTFLGLAGCLVHPARMDQWGLVVNEAMAAGLPVLVSRRAGCARDLVADGVNGHIFEPGDVDAIADLLMTIGEMSASERRRMGAEGARRIAAYRPTDFAAGLLQAFEAGRRRAHRGLSITAWLVTTALRLASRNARAFHAIPD
ncbi:MAG TPA: glycosyltransferase family 4 protein, partial [Candidatus Limnocylindria bacterium]|nr:glycosyltransferase family 4 protein [Candidatus Limnocylindria bacterium]